MKITLKNQTIELTDEDLKKHGLQRIEKKGELEEGDEYWTTNSNGEFVALTYDGHVFDKLMEETGNAFHTEEEAENHLAWLKARANIVRRIKELNDGYEWNWDDCARYYVFYNNEERCLGAGATDCYQEQPQEMYLNSRDLAKQLIKELEPELKIYLGVK